MWCRRQFYIAEAIRNYFMFLFSNLHCHTQGKTSSNIYVIIFKIDILNLSHSDGILVSDFLNLFLIYYFYLLVNKLPRKETNSVSIIDNMYTNGPQPSHSCQGVVLRPCP